MSSAREWMLKHGDFARSYGGVVLPANVKSLTQADRCALTAEYGLPRISTFGSEFWLCQDVDVIAAVRDRVGLMIPRLLVVAILVAALAGCATTRQPGPTAAQLHAELERCKAQHAAHNYTGVNLCFAQARRELTP